MSIRYGWILMQDTICQGSVVSDWATATQNDYEVEYPDLASLKDKAKELLDLRIGWLKTRITEVEMLPEPEEDEALHVDSDAAEAITSLAYDDAGEYSIVYVAIEGEGPEAVMSFHNDARDPTPLAELYNEAGRNGTLVWPPPEEAAEAA